MEAGMVEETEMSVATTVIGWGISPVTVEVVKREETRDHHPVVGKDQPHGTVKDVGHHLAGGIVGIGIDVHQGRADHRQSELVVHQERRVKALSEVDHPFKKADLLTDKAGLQSVEVSPRSGKAGLLIKRVNQQSVSDLNLKIKKTSMIQNKRKNQSLSDPMLQQTKKETHGLVMPGTKPLRQND